MNPATDYQVTEFLHPHEPVKCLVGGHHMNVPYRNWLQMEIDRWQDKNCRTAWVEENSEGLVAMFTLREYCTEVLEDNQ